MTPRRRFFWSFQTVFFVLLASAAALYADNCGSLSDCYGTVASAAAAVASLATALGLSTILGGLFGLSMEGLSEAAGNVIDSNFWTGGSFANWAGAGIAGLEAIKAAHLEGTIGAAAAIAAWGGTLIGAVSEGLELANIYQEYQGSDQLGKQLAVSGGIDVLGAALGMATIDGAVAAFPFVAAAAGTLVAPALVPIVAGSIVAAGTIAVLGGEGMLTNAAKAGGKILIDAGSAES